MYIHINIQRIYTYVCAIRRLVSFCRLFLSWVAMDQAKTQLFNIFFCIFLVIAGKLILLAIAITAAHVFVFVGLLLLSALRAKAAWTLPQTKNQNKAQN